MNSLKPLVLENITCAIEPTTDSTILIDCPLYDSEALTHFENLLSCKLGHVTVHTGVAV